MQWFTLEERYKEAFKELSYTQTNESKYKKVTCVPIGFDVKEMLSLYKRYRDSCNPIYDMAINRLVMGSMRYNTRSLEVSPKYDLIKTMETKLNLYKQSGNQENLVDLINYCVLEIINRQHPKAHFEAGDDTTHAVEK